MPYSGAERGLAFPVRAICLHLERESAPQVPVEGQHVPGEFHGRWNRIPKVIMGKPYCRNGNVVQIPGRHQPPWRNVSKIFFENRSSGGVVELGRHQPPHRSVSEISEEIEATEVPAVA